MSQNKTNELRVFISSTFRDLQEEREHLIKKIFPEIRALCRERGITFTEVDLRWGLTEDEGTYGRIIRTCLEEVDRCRPYFIGITGNRYGYVPQYLDIQKDPELLRQYPWVEQAVLEAMSMTAMEIQYALTHPTPSGREVAEGRGEGVRFYFRRERATLGNAPDGDEARQLADLKKRIIASGSPIQEFRDPASLGEMVYDDLIEIIRRDFADATPLTPLDEERSKHTAFAASRRHAYIADSAYLKRMNEWYASEEPPLVIYAESGSGKSSLVAFWCEQLRRREPETFIIEHYVGIGAGDSDHLGMIRHIMQEIKERFSREEEFPTTSAGIEQGLGQWLGYASDELAARGERMVLVLDGLNQLGGGALHLLWIPDVIGPAIRLILTSTVEETLVVLRQRGWRQIGMQPLREAEREAVVVRFLSEYHKELPSETVKRIAADVKCAHPLFLRTLLEELRIFGRHEAIEAYVDHLLESTGTEDLFQRVLERMEEDYNVRAVRDVMMLLWASKGGLGEDELAELTGVSRLRLATLLLGLDYHLVRRDGLLTFFHDYLRRAVVKRCLGDSQRQRQVHEKLAGYFEQVPVTLRSTRELLYALESLGQRERLEGALTNIERFKQLQVSDEFEVLRLWSNTEPSAIAAAYRAGLDRWLATAPREDRGVVLQGVIEMLHIVGAWSEAQSLASERLLLARENGDRSEEAVASSRLGYILMERGEYEDAFAQYEHARDLYTELGDRRGLSGTTNDMGLLYFKRQEYDKALECYRQAKEICGEIRDRRGLANAIGGMGAVYAMCGEYDLALESLQRAAEEHREIGYHNGLTQWLCGIGTILVELAQAGGPMPEYLPKYVAGATVGTWLAMSLEYARTCAEECIAISDALSKPDTQFDGRVLLARIEAAEGRRDVALQRLTKMLENASEDAQRAELHYQLWKIGERDHAAQALSLYEALYATTSNLDSHKRIEELTAIGEDPAGGGSS